MASQPDRVSSAAVPACRGDDAMLETLEAFAQRLGDQLAASHTAARDNPGATPPTFSLKDAGGTNVVTFGVIDRTCFWTWDAGTSNHYAKRPSVMTDIVTGELAAMKILA
jgi:hypothetical protein